MRQETIFTANQIINALKGEGGRLILSMPQRALLRELGICGYNRNMEAEVHLREYALAGKYGAEGIFFAVYYLLRRTGPMEPETYEALDRVKKDPHPEIQAIVAKAMAAIG